MLESFAHRPKCFFGINALHLSAAKFFKPSFSLGKPQIPRSRFRLHHQASTPDVERTKDIAPAFPSCDEPQLRVRSRSRRSRLRRPMCGRPSAFRQVSLESQLGLRPKLGAEPPERINKNHKIEGLPPGRFFPETRNFARHNARYADRANIHYRSHDKRFSRCEAAKPVV